MYVMRGPISLQLVQSPNQAVFNVRLELTHLQLRAIVRCARREDFKATLEQLLQLDARYATQELIKGAMVVRIAGTSANLFFFCLCGTILSIYIYLLHISLSLRVSLRQRL